jgi:hypothetical protein
MAFDVFEEADPWPHIGNAICDVGPEVAWILLATSLSRVAEWLARIPSREDVHQSAKAPELEGFKIRPDRCRIQASRFHFRDQISAGKCFDLAVSDSAQSRDNSPESEINPGVSRTEGHVCNCLGSSHIKNKRFRVG